MELILFKDISSVKYNTETKKMEGCTEEEFLRYLKGRFRNRHNAKKNIVDVAEEEALEIFEKINPEECALVREHLNWIVENIETVQPFTYAEVFRLADENFRRKVFQSIDIGEMFENLGAVRIKTDGIELNLKTFDRDGNYLGDAVNNNIYEVYEASGDKLGLEGQKLYAVKCWCTTTNKEHYLWIDDQHKNDPLAAIAATFHVPEEAIPHITGLNRQGDVLVMELDKKIEIKEPKKTVPLTKDQYFGWLRAQS